MHKNGLFVRIREVANGYCVDDLPDHSNGVGMITKSWVAADTNALSELIKKLAEENKTHSTSCNCNR